MNAIFSLPPVMQGHSLRRTVLILACGLLIACERPGNTAATTGATSPCDLNHASCTVSTNWGTATVTLTPTPVPVLQPINIELRLASPASVDVLASLNGVDMDMGPNSVRLQRANGGLWHGTTTVPICLTGTMRWQLRLELGDGVRQETIAFGFSAPIGQRGAN